MARQPTIWDWCLPSTINPLCWRCCGAPHGARRTDREAEAGCPLSLTLAAWPTLTLLNESRGEEAMTSERVQRQIDRLLDEAESALAGRNWPRVRDLANDALALDPANADACAFIEAAERAGATSDRAAESRPSARATPLPSSFASGRYAVRAFLSEGAKKRVYLAHDARLDRDVAFALIKTEGLDADGIVRVRREAQAMG